MVGTLCFFGGPFSFVIEYRHFQCLGSSRIQISDNTGLGLWSRTTVEVTRPRPPAIHTSNASWNHTSCLLSTRLSGFGSAMFSHLTAALQPQSQKLAASRIPSFCIQPHSGPTWLFCGFPSGAHCFESNGSSLPYRSTSTINAADGCVCICAQGAIWRIFADVSGVRVYLLHSGQVLCLSRVCGLRVRVPHRD
ncbi:hypothetical protein DENSPDRAFT_238022 [Dentipellis sp. KUC8613]|nr:hypothetical protein DENSPDRAFT_238022 [Dentipellis sp. KUC8613]